MPGIKFALGENVKRRNQTPSDRYPHTRMGVETFIRDRVHGRGARVRRRDPVAVRGPADRRAASARFRRGAISSSKRSSRSSAGERLVHCHSYRQDEILMLIRVAQRLRLHDRHLPARPRGLQGRRGHRGPRRGGQQLQRLVGVQGRGDGCAAVQRRPASTDVGVLVSFNSDSSELARRMNTEASKAVRYGGLEPHEALKFVTINPAKQLGIGDRTGSLEVGKDADFVIWSADPLSTYARCEETWIDGAKYFDLETDAALRARIHDERERLVQKMLAQTYGAPETNGADDAPPAPATADQPTVRRKP